ncbi:MAG TPA: ATP-binding cassette domain-containing protein, partial [Atopobiaceae bacterium]|nr:ATP-binding cassette domain-containing protein [Atopobiaceae bacterium]
GRVAREGTPEEVFSTGRDTILDLGLEMPFAARLSQRLDMPLTCDEERLANAVAASFTSLPRAEKDLRASSSHVMPVAQVEHVSFAYGPRVNVLDDISFSVDEGSSTAIVGQTGSGKSTLLRLLCGLQAPDTGRVLVYGNDSSTRRGRKAVRAHVGYVMQHPERQLFAETVEKDVAFGPANLRLPKDEVARRVDAALELVGLAEKRLNSPFELSGGQRRLCALAGILAMEPRLLVLDEPTAGLDPHGRALLREVLARLSSGGVTLIQVTHSMEDAARADHVIVLDQSRILLAGTPAEVFAPAGNEELLSKIGLGIPRSLAFARALEARGILGLGDPLTTDELLAALVKGGDRGVSA